MTDHLSPELRSENMRRIRSKGTSPEMTVRRTAHALGYRFRLHRKGLPGAPDLVFSSRRKVIFVHGCFWHRHKSCSRATMPKTNTSYWKQKFKATVERDRRNMKKLKEIGWSPYIIWECSTRDLESLIKKIDGIIEG